MQVCSVPVPVYPEKNTYQSLLRLWLATRQQQDLPVWVLEQASYIASFPTGSSTGVWLQDKQLLLPGAAGAVECHNFIYTRRHFIYTIYI